jgi:cobyrinic acid a,c-diamide synthase
MGTSAAAIALGFQNYDREVKIAGVILNRVGSDTHEAMLREAMAGIGMPVFGVLRRQEGLGMPERHLGLVPVEERSGAEEPAKKAVEAMGRAVGKQVDVDSLLKLAETAAPLQAETTEGKANNAKPVCRIGVARDEAFSFYYPASLQVLKDLGAELVTFSPLSDKSLPQVDGLLIGGGFPEMFSRQLEDNHSLRLEIREKALSGLPIYAECGGYMYLMESLQDFEGQVYNMTGIFPGRAVMTHKLQTVGYIEARLTSDTVLGRKGSLIHGHEFHFSVEEDKGEAEERPFDFTRLRNGQRYGPGQLRNNTLGSYLHLHFAGCPEQARAFVEACAAWKERN